MENRQKINSFTDLVAWQEGHKFVLSIYNATAALPRKESYVLADQMRRCGVSITSNIAKGFSRRTAKDKAQFYYIALGSVTEIQNQLLLAKDLLYISPTLFDDLTKQSILVHKLLFGLIKHTRN